MSQNSDPIEIRETSTREIQITWADQHVSRFDYVWLREHCPCALCRSKRGQDVKESVAFTARPDIHPLDIQTVGRYALSFAWNDGHDAGIYSFDMLRAACDCEHCAAQPRLPAPDS